MNKETPITRKVPIDLSVYHNSETGELLESELKPGTTLTRNERTGLVAMHTDDYAVIDSKAMAYLMSTLNNVDLANFMKMAVVTKTPSNIVYNGNIPHTNETLQTYLDVKSESMYIKLMRRLMKAGVIYQIKGLIHGHIRVCYILNPYISRKRRTVEETVLQIFTEFKDLNTLADADNKQID